MTPDELTLAVIQITEKMQNGEITEEQADGAIHAMKEALTQIEGMDQGKTMKPKVKPSPFRNRNSG